MNSRDYPTWSDSLAAAREREEAIEEQRYEDAEFLTELEARSMSTWSESETARYNELTGQSPELGSDALTMTERVAGLK